MIKWNNFFFSVYILDSHEWTSDSGSWAQFNEFVLWNLASKSLIYAILDPERKRFRLRMGFKMRRKVMELQIIPCASRGLLPFQNYLAGWQSIVPFLLLYPWIEQEMSAGQMCWKRNVFIIQPSKNAQKKWCSLICLQWIVATHSLDGVSAWILAVDAAKFGKHE